jgi:regulator of sirC expression with transglutaminase-like and TPR domain
MRCTQVSSPTLVLMPDLPQPLPPPLQLDAPTALSYFAALVAVDTGLPLLEAAISVAQDEDSKLDVQGVLAQIDGLSHKLARRLPADMPPLNRLRQLNQYFFNELGFAGNVNHYYDRGNSMLPRVLVTRRGIPLTLGLLFIEMAQTIGLKAAGVSFPGHFLVKLHLPDGAVIIDPFSGRSLGHEELEERLQPLRAQRGLIDDNEVPLGMFLQAAPPRDILARLLRNLKVIDHSAQDWTRLAQVQRRLIILLPQAWEEQRDLAVALGHLGQHKEAAQALELYLQHRADAEDMPGLHKALRDWQRAS